MQIASIETLNALYGQTPVRGTAPHGVDANVGFDSMLKSVMNNLKETNALQKNAESMETAFLLGEMTDAHSLMIAEQKANIALQYTVAIKDAVLKSYETIMNMQI